MPPAGPSARIDSLDIPVARFCLSHHRRQTLVVGLSGPQGSGKSTLAERVATALSGAGISAISISIDDFYRTHQEQVRLAEKHPDNRYLEHRGYPGTHDIGLGEDVLANLVSRDAREVAIPVYDKGAHGGRGDRAASPEWRRVRGPFDIVILEGWLLGFRPSPVDEIEDRDLELPNRYLAEYERWHRFFGAFVHLEAHSVEDIVGWRIDAEEARRRAGGGGLSREEAKDYIQRFLPAYRLYVPRLREDPPTRATMRIVLGANRLPDGC